jgi:hypothetical protein
VQGSRCSPWGMGYSLICLRYPDSTVPWGLNCACSFVALEGFFYVGSGCLLWAKTVLFVILNLKSFHSLFSSHVFSICRFDLRSFVHELINMIFQYSISLTYWGFLLACVLWFYSYTGILVCYFFRSLSLVLRIEPSATCMLHKHSTTWTTPSSLLKIILYFLPCFVCLFACLCFEDWPLYVTQSGWPWTQSASLTSARKSFSSLFIWCLSEVLVYCNVSGTVSWQIGPHHKYS